MKYLLIVLMLFGFISSSVFGTDKIQTVLVTTPVYHTLDDGGVKFAKIPFTGWDIDNPFISCGFYSSPRLVLKSEEHHKQDINLLSVYKIKVQSNLDNEVTTIYISISDSVKPKSHHFTVKEIAEFARIAVRSDFPDQKSYVIVLTERSIKDVLRELSVTK